MTRQEHYITEGERELLRALEIFVACQQNLTPTDCSACAIGRGSIISESHHSICYYLRRIQSADKALAHLRELPCCSKEMG